MKDLNKTVLIINDVTGYGKVSSLAMIPIMSKLGIHPYVLPTAIVSNTMDYGSSEILDTTEFMYSCVNKWKSLGFSFNNISTGLINNDKQFDIIEQIISDCNFPVVMVDPIMADNGEFYPGMYSGALDAYRKLARYATIFVPNFTEATLLTSMFEDRTELNDCEYNLLTDGLLKICPGVIIITGCKDADGNHFNLVVDHEGNFEKIKYDCIPISYVGTGDVFSATLFAEFINGKSISEAVKIAANTVIDVINSNIENPDHFDLRIETVL